MIPPPQQKKETKSIDEAIQKILSVHNVPCVILIKVNSNYEFSIEAVAKPYYPFVVQHH